MPSASDAALAAMPFDPQADNGFAARREEARRVREIRSGRDGIAKHVEMRLRSAYNVETFARMKVELGIVSSNNPGKDIADRALTEWAEGAKYSLLRGDGDVEGDEAVRFARLMDVLRFDVLGSEIAEEDFWHPFSVVVPTVLDDPQTGLRTFKPCLYTPEHANPVADDRHPGLLRQLDLYWTERTEKERGKVEEVEVKRIWTSDEVADFVRGARGEWEEHPDPERRLRPNPYRRIPARIFTAKESVTQLYSDSYGSALADLTIAVNAAQTLIDFQIPGQIKVLGGNLKDMAAGQVLYQAGAVDLTGTDYQVLDFQTDLAGLDEVAIERKRRRALASVGLPPDELSGGGADASGAALAIRYRQQRKKALERRKPLTRGLVDLYWLALHVLAVELKRKDAAPIDGIGADVSALPPYDTRDVTDEASGETRSEPIPLAEQSVRFVVDPIEPQDPETWTEKEARLRFLLERGYKSDAEVYREIVNPDVTDAEAEALVEKNRRLSTTLQSNGQMGMVKAILKRAQGQGEVK